MHEYFKASELYELFEFDPEKSQRSAETLELLLKRDGFEYERTPTNVEHIE